MFLQNIKISKLLSCLRTKPKNMVLLLLSFKHRSQICRKTRFLCKTNCSYAIAQTPCVYYTHIIQDWYDRMHFNLRLGSVSLSRCLSLSFVSLSWSVKSVAKTDQLGQLPSQAKQHWTRSMIVHCLDPCELWYCLCQLPAITNFLSFICMWDQAHSAAWHHVTKDNAKCSDLFFWYS